jgi:hypothetical protein
MPFDSSWLMNLFLALPKLPGASAIVRAARLYASAMEQIESLPEVSYQLFISAVETIAGEALEKWVPDNASMLTSKSGLVSFLTKHEELSRDAADRIALESCKDNRWSNRKFKKFLLDNLDRKEMRVKDDLFIVPDFLIPADADIEKALGEIYQTRSGATHAGYSFPPEASVGPSVWMPVKAISKAINGRRSFPPIGWFERVVNCAICGFIRKQVEGLISTPNRPR